MVMVAIRRPVIEVLGWFQMFERVFMQDAPWVKTGSTGRLRLTIVVLKTTVVPRRRSRESTRGGGVIRGPVRRHGCGRSQFWKLPWFRSGFQWRGSAPWRHPNLGRACSFARYGISDLCLAVFKGRETSGIGLQMLKEKRLFRIAQLWRKPKIAGLTIVCRRPVGRGFIPGSNALAERSAALESHSLHS
jgi:hypothetical protein